jgi:hypothetical protein
VSFGAPARRAVVFFYFFRWHSRFNYLPVAVLKGRIGLRPSFPAHPIQGDVFFLGMRLRRIGWGGILFLWLSAHSVRGPALGPGYLISYLKRVLALDFSFQYIILYFLRCYLRKIV